MTGYLAGLDGSICGKRAIAAMTDSMVVLYDMGFHNSMRFDMKMLYVYKFRRLIADCRRPVAGEKGERLIQVEPNNNSLNSLRSGAWGVQ